MDMEKAYAAMTAALCAQHADALCAWAQADVTDGDKVDISMVQILSEVPCRLSKPKQRGKSAPDVREGLPTAEDEYVLFTAPDVALSGGEKARVTCLGGVFDGVCGKSMRYRTHNETPFVVKRVV